MLAIESCRHIHERAKSLHFAFHTIVLCLQIDNRLPTISEKKRTYNSANQKSGKTTLTAPPRGLIELLVKI